MTAHDKPISRFLETNWPLDCDEGRRLVTSPLLDNETGD